MVVAAAIGANNLAVKVEVARFVVHRKADVMTAAAAPVESSLGEIAQVTPRNCARRIAGPVVGIVVIVVVDVVEEYLGHGHCCEKMPRAP